MVDLHTVADPTDPLGTIDRSPLADPKGIVAVGRQMGDTVGADQAAARRSEADPESKDHHLHAGRLVVLDYGWYRRTARTNGCETAGLAVADRTARDGTALLAEEAEGTDCGGSLMRMVVADMSGCCAVADTAVHQPEEQS